MRVPSGASCPGLFRRGKEADGSCRISAGHGSRVFGRPSVFEGFTGSRAPFGVRGCRSGGPLLVSVGAGRLFGGDERCPLVDLGRSAVVTGAVRVCRRVSRLCARPVRRARAQLFEGPLLVGGTRTWDDAAQLGARVEAGWTIGQGRVVRASGGPPREDLRGWIAAALRGSRGSWRRGADHGRSMRGVWILGALTRVARARSFNRGRALVGREEVRSWMRAARCRLLDPSDVNDRGREGSLSGGLERRQSSRFLGWGLSSARGAVASVTGAGAGGGRWPWGGVGRSGSSVSRTGARSVC